MTRTKLPKRGEIWLVNFDPTIGKEIKKTRPAVVISSNAIGILPIKLVAPLTDWKNWYKENLWHIKIEPNKVNNLAKESSVDVLQLRGVDRQRFIRFLGMVAPEKMSEITIAIVTVIEAELS